MVVVVEVVDGGIGSAGFRIQASGVTSLSVTIGNRTVLSYFTCQVGSSLPTAMMTDKCEFIIVS